MTDTLLTAGPFTARLTMLSDWHIGSGAGIPGGVDRLVQRDADGLPYVPAKSLIGVWRDAAERVAFGLDEGADGPWHHCLRYLFGDQPALAGENDDRLRPCPAALQAGPARFPLLLRELVRGDSPRARLLRSGFTFVRPGIAIEPETGSAKPEHLRFVEMARRDAVLEAECSLPPGAPEAARALLGAAARLVERIGGKRRRGAGLCRLEAGPDPLPWIRAHRKFTDVPERRSEDVAERRSEAATPLTSEAESGEWDFFRLTLELNGPLAVTDRRVGNVMTSLDYLPGGLLLPELTRRFGPDIRPAIFRGDFRVLPAFLQVDGARGRPAPNALFRRKEVEQLTDPRNRRVINRFVTAVDEGESYKQVRAGIFGPSRPNAWPVFATMPMTERTHNSVEDLAQRPTDAVGGVYTNEAIAPRAEDGRPVVLVSELRIRRSACARLGGPSAIELRLRELLVRVGRSRKDDYGSIVLNCKEIDKGEASRRAAPLPVPKEGGLIVWLLSDVLLRDERLRPAPTAAALARELERALERGAGSLRLACDNLLLTTAARVRRLDSWNANWGLPRPTLAALQAGSCFAFVNGGPDEISSNALARVAAAGIGERRAEGFGDLSFNDPLAAEPARGTPVRAEPALERRARPISKDASLIFEFARLVEKTLARETIRQAALRFSVEETNGRLRRQQVLGWTIGAGTTSEPPMSQLGGLRQAVVGLRRPDDVDAVLTWLESLAQNSNRAKKWPANSLDQLKGLIKGDHVWEYLNLTRTDDWPALTENGEQALRKELRLFAVRALVFASIQAHKRDLERSSKGGPR